MTELLVNERGSFWWAETLLLGNAFAPEGAVAGKLQIDPAGRTTLDLDEVLPRSTNKFVAMLRTDYSGRSIAGLLHDGRHVWLHQLLTSGMHVRSNAPSSEGFHVQQAVLSKEPMNYARPLRISELQLDLRDYARWVGRPGLRSKWKRGGRFAVAYTPSRGRGWILDQARLTMYSGLNAKLSGDGASVTLSENAFLRYRPRKSIDLEPATDIATRIEDLLILLTDSERGLPFPRGKSTSGQSVEIYFPRMQRGTVAPNPADIWVTYVAVEEEFGEIVQTWFREHEHRGPGFHLYLGNRRGGHLYAEHQFASLVWGLESLHRSVDPSSDDEKIRIKIKRIVEQIQKSRDRTWAEKRLLTSSEPALADRIHQLFAVLPIAFAPNVLRTFCDRCAKRRNDLSHFGGRREGESYKDFLAEIIKLSRALDLLYHAIILQMAGVPKELVRGVFVGETRSPSRKHILEAAGLLTDVPTNSLDNPAA